MLRAEHLLAIMLQTGRPKDKARMAQLLDEATVDREYLETLMARHGLKEKWDAFKKGFPETTRPSR